MRRQYRKIRMYASCLTAGFCYIIGGLCLFAMTNIGLGGILFLPIGLAYAGFYVCAVLTDPRRIPRKRKPINFDLYALYEVEKDGRLGRRVV